MRWAKRNPFGDVGKFKLFGTTSGQFIGRSTSPVGPLDFRQIRFNVLEPHTPGTYTGIIGPNDNQLFGSIPGYTRFREAYTQYRISGIKLNIIVYGNYVYSRPWCVYVDAQSSRPATSVTLPTPEQESPDPAWGTPSITELPELRWSKYRMIQNAANGGKPTRLSVYYDVNKVQGPDISIRTDKDLTGTMSPSSGPLLRQSPKVTPWLRFGIMPISSVAPPSAQPDVNEIFYYRLNATVYVKGYGRVEITT